MIKIFKKKQKLKRVMVYAEIIECSKFYITHNFKNNKRKIVRKRRYRRMITVEEAKKELREYRENIKYI